MNLNTKTIFKIFIIASILMYVVYFPISKNMSNFEAVIVLAFSMLALVKARKNIALFIMFMFIFYVNYSVVMGEYLFFDSLSVPMNQVKSELVYGTTLRILLLFMSIIALFFDGKALKSETLALKLKNNWIIFYSTLIILILVLAFGIDRTESNSYSVKISAIFEYSKLLFLFAFYYSGGKKNRFLILISVMILFVLSDFYYGGRITSLQILILVSITIIQNKINIRNIIGFAGVGIVLNGVIGVYRSTYSISNINFTEILIKMFENLFVFDTATFAYYASATHVAAYAVSGFSIRVKSFLYFIKEFIVGSGSEFGDVTRLVRLNFFHNYGGGFIPTHFYFWLGWAGVLLIALIVVLFINKVDPNKNDLSKLIYIAFIINSPRWYLYSPNQLFRGVLFFVPILYVITRIIHTLTTKQRKLT